MALLVLIVTGCLLGWIATIIARVEDRGGILAHMGIGTLGTLIAGIASNSGSIIGGLSALAFVAALAGGCALLAGYMFWRKNAASE